MRANWILLTAAALASTLAGAAEIRMTQLLTCTDAGTEYAVFSTEGAPANSVTVVQTDPGRDPILVGGTLTKNAQTTRIDLPGYWKPTSVPLGHCTPAGTQATLRASAPRTLAQFQRRFTAMDYFIAYDDVDPSKSIDELIQEGKAIPVHLDLLCIGHEESQSPGGCDEIRILDQVIPVDPHP